MKKLFLVFTFFVSFVQAETLEIVDVKRNIPLAESEPVYKDFYIKGITGLKKNMVVKAVRKVAVKDVMLKPVGDFVAVVGLLKIIQVSDSIAVAREFKLVSRDNEPMLEQIGIMVGDEIDVRDSFNDTSKPTAKKTAVIVPVPVEKPTDPVPEKTAEAPQNPEI